MFFITVRLANSLPIHIMQAFQAEHEREKQIIRAKYSGVQQYKELYNLDKKYFGRFDAWLDCCVEESPRWLADEHVAHIVADEIHRLDGQWYLTNSLLSHAQSYPFGH